jgi:plastocyanin
MDMSTMSSSPSASDSGGAGSSSKLVITIKDFGYAGPTSVPAGSTVTVRNEDSVAHTLTADSAGGFDVTIAPGKSATFKAPAKTGSYPYHCTYHANMHGTLKVS